MVNGLGDNNCKSIPNLSIASILKLFSMKIVPSYCIGFILYEPIRKYGVPFSSNPVSGPYFPALPKALPKTMCAWVSITFIVISINHPQIELFLDYHLHHKQIYVCQLNTFDFQFLLFLQN